jgi:predicted metallo-beta-lactamase superfamily hydrolase
MDNLIEKVFELKHKLTDQEYLELNNNIMEIYKTKAIIIKEDGNCILTSQQQTNIYNETSAEDMEEYELNDNNIEIDDTLL